MKITVYSNRNCVQCEQTKRWLSRHSIEFDTALIEDSPTAQKLIDDNQFVQAPVVVAGSQVWSGFRLEKLKSLVPLIFGEKK